MRSASAFLAASPSVPGMARIFSDALFKPSQTKHVCKAATTRHVTTAQAEIAEYTDATLEKLRHSRLLARSTWIAAFTRTQIYIAIDATSGRGTDTLTLARMMGPRGKVYAFDIQQTAIDETVEKYNMAREMDLAQLDARCESHEDLGVLGLAEGSVCCITYNLGWYPGGKRDIVTKPSSTLKSLESAEKLVAVGGVISVMAYLGHEGGADEEKSVNEWARQLCAKTWSCSWVSYPNRNTAPKLLTCERIQ